MTRDDITRYQQWSVKRALGLLPISKAQDELIERSIKNEEKRRKARTGAAV